MRHVPMNIVHSTRALMLVWNSRLLYVSEGWKSIANLSRFLGKQAHKVRAKVMATIGTVDHDFVLPNHDVCQQLGCPLKPGVPYSYHNSMFVSPTYPSVSSFFSLSLPWTIMQSLIVYFLLFSFSTGESQSNAILFNRW